MRRPQSGILPSMSTAAATRPPAPQVLVVDDEQNLRHLLRVILEREGHAVAEASNGADALHLLARLPSVRVVLCDVRMPKMDGFGFLDAAASRGLSVVMMSAYGGSDTAIQALNKGAFDYISKPFRADEIRGTVRRILEQAPPPEEAPPPPPPLIVESAAMKRLEAAAGRVAVLPDPVLIVGAPGAGKNLFAEYVHALSGRRGGLTVHACGASGLPVEPHAPGSLVLDHLEDLTAAEADALAAIVDAGSPRVIGTLTKGASTLAAARAHFKGATLTVPSLADRGPDLAGLIALLVGEIAERVQRPGLGIEPALIDALTGRDWTGNVRQLRNLLQQAILLEESETLTAETLLPVAPIIEPTPSEVVSFGPDSGDSDLSIKRHSARLEAHLIALALTRTGGNRTQAARLLDISYKALAYKVKDYGLDKR